MTMKTFYSSKAQGRSIASYVTIERSEIANPAGLPGGCERGEQQTWNAARMGNLRRIVKIQLCGLRTKLKTDHYSKLTVKMVLFWRLVDGSEASKCPAAIGHRCGIVKGIDYGYRWADYDGFLERYFCVMGTFGDEFDIHFHSVRNEVNTLLLARI